MKIECKGHIIKLKGGRIHKSKLGKFMVPQSLKKCVFITPLAKVHIKRDLYEKGFMTAVENCFASQWVTIY